MIEGVKVFTKNTKDNIHYGVREFGMSAIMNGLALYGACFLWRNVLTFSDYARNAVRMSAIMRQRAIFVYTMTPLA